MNTPQALFAHLLAAGHFQDASMRAVFVPVWVAWGATTLLSCAKHKSERVVGGQRDMAYIFLLFVAFKVRYGGSTVQYGAVQESSVQNRAVPQLNTVQCSTVHMLLYSLLPAAGASFWLPNLQFLILEFACLLCLVLLFLRHQSIRCSTFVTDT